MTFNFYHNNLVRVNLTLALIDEHRRAQVTGLVKSGHPTSQHLEWAAAHAERRRLTNASVSESA